MPPKTPPQAAAKKTGAPAFIERKTSCPSCGKQSNRWIRYAFSSWLFPVPCDSCKARFYLSYPPAVFLLVWCLLSPLYLIAALYVSMYLFPQKLVIPGFLLIAFLSVFSLILVGKPKLR